MLAALGICVTETTVPLANVTAQTPEATPSVTVQLSPAGALVIVPLPRDAGDGATVSVAACAADVKPAFTAVTAPEMIAALQVAPAQAPVKPLNAPPVALTAVNDTVTPAGKFAEQLPLATPFVMVHEMPAGALVIAPLPAPYAPTVSEPGAAAVRYVTSTVRWPLIVTAQGLPTQLELHAAKIAPPIGSCVSVMTVPSGKLVLQAPVPGAVPFSVQSIPAGVLTICPLPTDAAFATIER